MADNAVPAFPENEQAFSSPSGQIGGPTQGQMAWHYAQPQLSKTWDRPDIVPKAFGPGANPDQAILKWRVDKPLYPRRQQDI